MDFVAQLNRLLEPIRVRVRMLICRAIVSMVDDSKAIQIVQLNLTKDDVKDGIERVQNYGFTSKPLNGAEAVALFLQGNRDNGLCIAIDDSRYRINTLPDGGVAMYDYDGNYVKMTKDNGIEINAQNKKVVVHADEDIEIGNENLKKLINAEFQDMFNNHVHNYVGFVGTGTPMAYTTSSPSKSTGSNPVLINAVPLAPPQINLFADEITDNEMTDKVKAQ